MNITDTEYKVIRSILANDFHDGNRAEEKINNPIWVNCIDCSYEPCLITGKTLSGVMSSLVKKGLVGTDGECCWLTVSGYEVATKNDKMKNKKTYSYKVFGSGVFPVDMLRYDNAAFADEESYNKFNTKKEYNRIVDHKNLMKQDEFNIVGKQPPTIARWNSFGWGVFTE